MAVSKNDLRQRYSAMATERLVELHARGVLTDAGESVVKQVLSERGVAPEVRQNLEMRARARVEEEQKIEESLASLGSRLAGQLLDTAIAIAVVIAGIAISRPGFNTPTSAGVWFFIAYILLADGLPGGQSFAKRWLGIAVVDSRTLKPCNFFQSFVRNLLLTFLGVIDWIFIFGTKRQRLGDMAASTIVINVSKHAPIASLAKSPN